jgi:hypothetical protein
MAVSCIHSLILFFGCYGFLYNGYLTFIINLLLTNSIFWLNHKITLDVVLPEGKVGDYIFMGNYIYTVFF